ncbi:YfcC family protein [Dongshaea marina]|uniref:YfcC family protein n=1 Tax=Dongshaea marina TaxID=2047966 RepID=UPI000D3EB423|nr:YfcC family protein [Dongshaea marina]
MSKLKFPSAFTILFLLIILVAALTWIIPAGKYETKMNPELGRETAVAGTYHKVEPNPQGLAAIFLAPMDGLYNHETNEANAIDVSLFILVIGGFLGIVNRTKAIDAGIERVMVRFKGREVLMIPILMALFAAGGTVYGMCEESIPFYILLVPVMMAARFDPLVAAATILLGAGIGTLGSTINAFATVIASNAAQIPFTQGMMLRIAFLVIGWLICVAYVMRYAAKIQKDPTQSIVYDLRESNRKHFLANIDEDEVLEFTLKRKLVLILGTLAFAVMIWGVVTQGWWMAKMGAVFLVFSIIIAFVARMSEEEFISTFIDGARDLLGVALIIGVARGIVVVMNNGMITDTILHAFEDSVHGLSNIVFINVIYWIEVLMSFLVPSSSGLAVLSMPILAPLADFAHVGRELVVTAYQSASGLVNLVTPTSAVVMGGLAIARVPYNRYLKWVAPLILILAVVSMILLSIGVMIG